MPDTTKTPIFRISSVLLIALSLSIGWGIRGNFGHEYGAMIAGCLATTAACLLSGREDWRRRVAFFAFFGAVGWGFGGTISYMQVIGYTHSGHLLSQMWGFGGLFLIGFLWAAMGGAGGALPAVADREWLTRLFTPMCWVLAVWAVLAVTLDPLAEYLVKDFTVTEYRHESPFYWFDADWLQAVTAVFALFLFDLWNRRFRKGAYLIAFGAGGALIGFLLQCLLSVAGLIGPLVSILVRREGDLSVVPAAELPINWPLFFLSIPEHLGWIFGLIAGVSIYFVLFGKFRSGSSLFMHMAVGWLVSFLILPTLLGIRMTPPRSDDWAGILGVFIGMAIYMLRNGMAPVAYASIVSGFIGGLGFSGVQCMKLLLTRPGNREIVSDPDVVQAWAHWQSANWHSWLEQSYGFVNGLAVAVALGLLATRTRKISDTGGPPRRWTQVFAVAFILFLLTYLNIFKNVAVWTNATMPAMMKAPLFASIELSTGTWFNLVYLMIAVAGIGLMVRHLRRPIALIPATWLGRGQLLYLVFLWMMVVANFERALMGFAENRIITEGVIFVNAIIVTVMILVCPRDKEHVPDPSPTPFMPLIRRAIVITMAGALLAIGAETVLTRLAYGDKHAGHAGQNFRFGPDANWRIAPIRKGAEHK